ncbi:hypothetical protein EYF80_005404 [Liparis tanakae]|uniref:Uncharacterized protein n=1 Tax=Liparis tanakae TaxID=230148 RepID=A0A4Z2J3A2_9TELE|nr:hypothetical protein EYF80_005404 [Liparis tanakae]
MPRLNEARCGCRDALPAARIDQLRRGPFVEAETTSVRSCEDPLATTGYVVFSNDGGSYRGSV